MTVAYTYNTVSREQYEDVFPEVLGTREVPSGMIAHAAGLEGDGTWHIIEIWESDEQRSQWERETLLPILQKHGVDITQGPPEWTRVEVEHLSTAAQPSLAR
jgi:hypothetical protein